MTDIQDLRAKSEEYAELWKKITQPWTEPDVNHDGELVFRNLIQPYLKGEKLSKTDKRAIKQLPRMFHHIQALQSALDEYEVRVERLRETEIELSRQGFDEERVKGIEIAIHIMTAEDEG